MSAEALLNALRQDVNLHNLTQHLNKFNLFDILKITRAELQHSNVLSWLLDQKGNHGLGDRIMREIIQLHKFTEPKNYQTFCIKREYSIPKANGRIDILANSQSEKYVLCIENKTFSCEHDDQLNRYKKAIEDTYQGYTKAFIYLSPEGEQSSDPDNWISMSYKDIHEIINKAKEGITLSSDVELFINHYIDTIERYIMGDQKTKELCAEIYKNNKEALDLIYKYKPDKISDVTKIIQKWAEEYKKEGKIDFDKDNCTKGIVRFTTKTMSKILPNSLEANSAWGTTNHYFYEIKVDNDGNSIYLMLTLNPENLKETNDIYTKIYQINAKYPTFEKHKKDRWLVPFKTMTIGIDNEKEEIKEHLDKFYEELRSFEEKIKRETTLKYR